MGEWQHKFRSAASSRALPGLAPSPADDLTSLLEYAVASHQAGRLTDAEKAYRKVLKRHPKQFDCLHLLGIICYQKGELRDALRHIDLALKIDPNAAAAHTNRAAVLHALNRSQEALAACDRAITLNPDGAESFSTRAAILNELQRFEEALASSERAIALKPHDAGAYSNRGNALKELKRRHEALESFDQALAIDGNFADAHNNRANVLNQLQRYREALASADRAIVLKPDVGAAHYNRGIALDQLRRPEEAVASYDRALALKPDYAEAHANRAASCLDLKRYDQALASYARAMEINPESECLQGLHLFAKMLVCDWTNLETDRSRLVGAVAAGSVASPPFQFIASAMDPSLQLACAQRYVEARYGPFPAPLWRGERYSHPRIRLAYLSGDFGDHPVSLLSAGMFERHDRSRFETTAISYGPDSPSPVRERLKVAFDRFIDAQSMSSDEIARTLREFEIDIAIDLSGFTDGARPDVLAQRPVPVQVNFLGYPGTLGRACWDYIIGDPFVIPEGAETRFGEQVARLPHSFMPNDSERKISATTPSRAEAGLPERGFVFCSFNNSYKITPDFFDIWMRLLQRVEGSVLWLSVGNATAMENLRGEATRRGVAPDRIVFAPKVPSNQDHLARLRLADLFLDTRYYNAHATAADALWAGVPIVTCAGSSFASRVAGSLLHAIGLPELATSCVSDYEALALALAGDPGRLAGLRETLARNRNTYPLFDTARFTRHLEAAYATMWERVQRGDPTQSFAVSGLG